MKQSADLKRLLTSIDHKSYPAYKDVRGAYDRSEEHTSELQSHA